MHFEIRPLYRRGERLQQKAFDRVNPVLIDLFITQEPHTPLGRPSLCASAHLLPNDVEPLSPLYDVLIEGMANLAFVISGTEFVGGKPFQQAWHCRPPLPKAPPPVVPADYRDRSSLDELI